MAQLFKAQFQAFLKKRLPDHAHTSAALLHDLNKLAKLHLPKGNHQILLHRMPKNELKHLARLECPTMDHTVVSSMKALREFSNAKEHQTCSRCSKKDSCRFKDLSFGEMAASGRDRAHSRIEDV